MQPRGAFEQLGARLATGTGAREIRMVRAGKRIEQRGALVGEQLEQTQSSLTEPNSPYANEMRAALGQSEDASPQELRRHAESLKRQEDSLESA